jgi:hypothetical protein
MVSTPSTPPSRNSTNAAVPVSSMNRIERRIASAFSSAEAARRRRCLRPFGGATSSSSERPPPASLAMESPMWVWALTNAGRTIESESVAHSSTATISPSSTTTRPETGSSSGPRSTVPSTAVLMPGGHRRQ